MPPARSKPPISFAPGPGDLPDDGTPVTFEQTFAKRIHRPEAQDPILTADAFKEGAWYVERQTDDGWEHLEVASGLPDVEQLRQDYGPGKYRLTPIDPRSGEQVEKLRIVKKIASITGQGDVLPFPGGRSSLDADDPYAQPPGFEDMPPWMRMQLAQAAEDRRENTRRAEAADARRQDFEQKMQLAEFQRAQREDEHRREDRAAADKAAARAAERSSELIQGGIALLSTIVPALLNRGQAAQHGSGVEARLLDAMLDKRAQREPASNSMRDTLGMLVAIDELADRRAERGSRRRNDEDDDEEDDDARSTLMGLLPAVLGQGGGGGGGQNGGQIPDGLKDKLLEEAMNDPHMIARYAMRNPTGVARTIKRALSNNPALENALSEAIEKDNDD